MKKKLLKLATLTLILVMLGMALTVTASAAWEETAQGWQFSENGRPATGWREIDGARFFFNSAGVMQTGWVEYNGQWFYMLPSGAMATGSWRVDGVWHNFGSGGTWSGESLPMNVVNQAPTVRPPVARPPAVSPPADQPSADQPYTPAPAPSPVWTFEGLWGFWTEGIWSYYAMRFNSDGTGALYFVGWDYENWSEYDLSELADLTWSNNGFFQVVCSWDINSFKGIVVSADLETYFLLTIVEDNWGFTFYEFKRMLA